MAADRSPAAAEPASPVGPDRSVDEQTLIEAAKKLFDAEEIIPRQ